MTWGLFLAAVVACLLVGAIGRLGVRLASSGEDQIPWPQALIASLVGGVSLLFLSAAQVGMGNSLASLCFACFGAALGVGAVVDRQTGWAPDVLVVILAAQAMVVGTAIAGWQISPVTAFLFGAGIVLVVNLVWILLAKFSGSARLLPPGDIIAFALPFMVFGISLSFVGVMLGIAILGILCRHSRLIHGFFTNPEVGEKVLREMEIEGINPQTGITLLSMALPLTWGALLIWLL